MSSEALTEAALLDSPACEELLQAVGSRSELSVAAIEKLKRDFGAPAFAAATRIVTARRKAEGKFPAADRLWLDPVRAEQATHRFVSEHKARRFADANVMDLCCGAGGDTFALAGMARSVISLDRDPDTVRRLSWNLAILGLSGQVLPVLGDATRPPARRDVLIHIDPDRRARDHSGRPTRQLDEYQPGVEVLIDLMRHFPGGAIKLGPASDFDTLETRAVRAGVKFETEVISLDGECKEATLWFGSLAGESRRRATLLPGGCTMTGKAARMAELADDRESLGHWLYELEPALIRSGLAGAFAAEHRLKAVTADGAWLTGPDAVDTPWARRFEVVETVPADRKIVRAAARKLGWKAAVVKTRGGVSAEKFAGWFDANPAGDATETLLISKSANGKSRAILALRCPAVRLG